MTAPIVAMKGGVDSQRYIDLLVPCPAKITLLNGEGPILLVGSHRDHGPGSYGKEVAMEVEQEEAAAAGGEKKESKILILKLQAFYHPQLCLYINILYMVPRRCVRPPKKIMVWVPRMLCVNRPPQPPRVWVPIPIVGRGGLLIHTTQLKENLIHT